MSLVEELIETVKHLPGDKQLQVRDFIVQLQSEAGAESGGRPFKSFLGALEHLPCDISEEDIAQARREMLSCPLSVVSCPLRPTTDN